MHRSVEEIMTSNPICVDESAPVTECARLMKEYEVGDVLVTKDGEVGGILTDRDITLRAVAEGRDPAVVTAGEICSGHLVTVKVRDSAETAMRLMRESAIRRVPVCDDGKAVGIVTLGDMALAEDRDSTLAEISAAPPNS